METRVSKALSMFEEGYNCSQSVFVTYADIYGIDRETALKLSSPLGAGVGRMREVCGAVTAMALIAGLENGNTNPKDENAKTLIYQNVRDYSGIFKEKMGSVICKDLLRILEVEKSATPELRTAEYYGTRPCSKAVAVASQTIEEMIIKQSN